MIAELGAFLALIALCASLAQAALGIGAQTNAPMAAASRACAHVSAGAMIGAFIALVAVFVRSDFSVGVVAAKSHSDKPLLYRIAGAWGNHEGSMLLWCLVSALFAAAMARSHTAMSHGLASRAVAVQGMVTAGALIYTLVLSNPFARLDPAPFQGASLNPLLQDPALALHPPMLYLGYVGLSAPFSLAIAALLEGKADAAWARALRPWVLLAWTCLTFGIALGSYWAYYELGWGGWWFWDPVENASFMPWLAATALIHSAIVTERRGSLAAWTILLAILGFAFALLGTFLVRSGVLTSVHAFAVDPRRGVAVLALIALALGGGLTLYALRAPRLARPSGFAAVSREGLLVLNNLGLMVAAGVVLIGTLYPLIIEAMTDRLISVGPPFFNLAFAPLMAALLIAMPAAPLLAWRRGDMAGALKALWFAGLVAVGAAAVTIAIRADALWAAFGLGVGAWLLAGALAYVWSRWARGGPRSLRRLAALPIAVWALTAAHAGAGVFAIGAIAETHFREERSAALPIGGAIDFAGRSITLRAVEDVRGPNYRAVRGVFHVSDAGGAAITHAERRSYDAGGAPTTEVAILSDGLNDLYIALGEPAQAQGAEAWTVRFYFNPLVRLIFLGAGLIGLGGILGLAALLRRRAAP